MGTQHWVMLLVVLALGYAVGVMYPNIGHKFGL